MRWSVFAVVAFAFLALDASLGHVLALDSLDIAPSFVAVLVVFVALWAPRGIALWAAWILGLLLDLVTDLPHGSDGIGPLLGPHALGYTFGCFLLLQIRSMLLRGRALTMAVMTVLCVIAASLVVVFVYAVHGWYPGENLHWADLRSTSELLRRLGIAVYSGLLAFFVGFVLVRSVPVWSFRGATQRGSATWPPRR